MGMTVLNAREEKAVLTEDGANRLLKMAADRTRPNDNDINQCAGDFIGNAVMIGRTWD